LLIRQLLPELYFLQILSGDTDSGNEARTSHA